MAGEDQLHAQLIDHIEAREELTRGVGRVAVVVVERDATEQVVAGEQQASLRLVQHDM